MNSDLCNDFENNFNSKIGETARQQHVENENIYTEQCDGTSKINKKVSKYSVFVAILIFVLVIITAFAWDALIEHNIAPRKLTRSLNIEFTKKEYYCQ